MQGFYTSENKNKKSKEWPLITMMKKTIFPADANRQRPNSVTDLVVHEWWRKWHLVGTRSCDK